MRSSALVRRPLAALVAATMAWISIVVVGTAQPALAAKEINISRSGPLGPITVIGDSVLLGSGLFGPTLPDQLSARGWGPIRFRAAGSANSGHFPVSNEFRSSYWIDLWQRQGWDPKHVVVNVGVNDSGWCRGSVECAYDSIMHMVDAIGPGHEIWWPTIVKTNAQHHISFNTALRQVAAERSDFHIWDWYTEYVTGGYRSGDEIHLDPAGYRRRSELMAIDITERFTRSLRTGGDVTLPSPAGRPSTFLATPPERIADTRPDTETHIAAGERLTVDLSDRVPSDATAVALYVASARARDRGYLSAGPCEAAASGATVNFDARTPTGAPTVSALGNSRTVCVFASVDTDVIVDLQGVFVSNDSGARLTPLATPSRLHDSRDVGRSDTVVVHVDPSLDAVAINLTAARSSTTGYLSASSCTDRTGAANVNFSPGPAVSASAIVPVDDDGTFCVVASQPTDVIIDLTAELSVDGDLAYVPVAPTRMLDTRSGEGGWQPGLGAHQKIDVGVAPPNAAAVTGTVALIRPATSGFLTVDGCQGDASTSSVNAASNEIVANSLTSALFGGRMCITASSRAHVVFDTNGWWIDS